MKLYNAIAIYDVYIVAESGESARDALIAAIVATGELPASELVAVESSREGAIRDAWRDQKPLVATDVSDADFETIKGQSTVEIFRQLYTKR